MVKFSKQLQGQLVPEWKSAYCNYWQLKKILKQVKLQWEKEGVDCPARSPRRLLNSPLRSFGHLTRRRGNSWAQNDMIMVHCRTETDEQEDIYETELFEPIAEAENEKAFFSILDAELNKINKFFKRKEEEYIKRSQALEKQMKILKEMRRMLVQQTGGTSLVFQDPSRSRKEAERSVHASKIQDTEFPYLNQDSEEKSIREHVVANKNELENPQKFVHSIQVTGQPDSLPIYNHIKINIPLTTPAMAIATLSEVLQGESNNFLKNDTNGKDDILVSRKKVHQAEKMLRMAYVEFYRGLSLLKSYSSLNMVAFAKIMKKYEKVTGRNASVTYLRVVEGSYFNSSDQVVKLMDKIEALFTGHFTKDNRRQAMTYLRPTPQKASHNVTFFLGLFTGCVLSLFAAFAMIVRISEGYISAQASQSEQRKYMETIFPVFSMLSLILLHMYMYGWNVYAWRHVRINYAFIFEFAPRSELRYREILLLCTGLSTIVVGGMVTHLVAYSKAKASPYVDLIPLAVLMVFVSVLVCPFNLFYRSSRFFFLRSMQHIILSPLYKVVLADFFLADQLASQVPTLRSMEYITCYYVGGHFKHRDFHACTRGRHYKHLAYIISLMPYWFRIMQCFRRWIDENDRAHIANGGKYLSAMIAVAVKLTYGEAQSVVWMVMLVITSTVATIYQMYWDLVVDWGLLQPNSSNPWLRDRLILKRKSIYVVSMVLNGVLRLAWLQSVTHLQFGDLDTQITDFIFASLEVLRRGHWNFYRIENEHLNNVGKYRAVKTVPLPFGDMEEYEV
ncbi:hypothetical protein O6H91_07G056400 [Diphasiastrum complanatum]|uniref:Uncharacterized protein n=3 Tax=Diphasiastrum complanatum TaxID=34168 RepID=A0ACC2D5E8_DIPCM|nr:hypothetical protein O6H91_07G056400 [Diphasiastrum complanatum]KAJ7549500.1 hypothetical protein O6H91_07G056400 [Diphasiastrum complanatum]KAJ7549501.1 hypothetical protein O6H91_07G056400 [Diphasiastrum complanatum]